MRKPFVIGNWKMNLTGLEARALVAGLLPELSGFQSVERVLCPPFPYLMLVSAMLTGTGIGLGAQTLHSQESGAYTGEVSPAMVAEFCQYVIIGHSERRGLFGETDEVVNRKVKAAVSHQLIPILCVGETLEQKDSGQTVEVIERQVYEGLKGVALEHGSRLLVAYEPVWAIGSGRAITAWGANAVLANHVFPVLAGLFGEAAAREVRLLYGGSINSRNAAEFVRMPEIDGALVGGASLKPAEFIAIVKAAAASV